MANNQNNSEADKSISQSEKSGSGSAAVNSIMNPDNNTSSGIGTPVWKLCVGLMELIALGVLSQFVISDLRVIRWFEQKKKRRY